MDELMKKHKQEKKELQEQLEQLQISLESNQTNFELNQQSQKVSKAQKRRERKERDQQDREKRLAEDEQESINHIRNIEINKFDKLFKEHNLKLYDIPSNGDYMYEAIRHQLSLKGVKEYSIDELRKLTANSLRKNKNNYLPFLTSIDENELMNDQEFDKYCSDVELTKKCGGNLELKILSESIKVNIAVYQADGPIIELNFEESIISQPLLLNYHEYLYQLGGHYNSLLKND